MSSILTFEDIGSSNKLTSVFLEIFFKKREKWVPILSVLADFCNYIYSLFQLTLIIIWCCITFNPFRIFCYSSRHLQNKKRVLQPQSKAVLLKYFEIYYFHATTTSFKIHSEIKEGLMIKKQWIKDF